MSAYLKKKIKGYLPELDEFICLTIRNFYLGVIITICMKVL